MIQIKCADCGCLPVECRQSKSPKECPIAVGINVVVRLLLTKNSGT